MRASSAFFFSSSAFSVDGENYPKDELNGLVKNLIAVNQLTAPGGLAASKDLSSIVSVMVQYKAGGHVLKEYGGSISEAARSAATAQLNQSSPQGLDDQTKTLFVDIAVTGQAIDALPVPGDIEARYEANPVRTGVVCIAETTVRPCSRRRRSTNSSACCWWPMSNALVGSSSNRIGASWAIARAMTTR